MADVKQVLY